MCKPFFDPMIKLKENAMLKIRPELFDEWDFEKNNKLGIDIYKTTKGSHKKVTWICEFGHKWGASIKSRTLSGNNCPYCSGHKALKGYNDISTTNPELAKILADSEDGYRYTEQSNVKVDWKCPDCERIIKDKTIASIRNRCLPCPCCSDNTSMPERIMANVLYDLDVDFTHQKTFNWLEDRWYDFYLPDYNIIIEVHGAQHYKEKVYGKSQDYFKKEQENDLLKKELAYQNRIDYYIEINASEPSIAFIKDSIENSKLLEILNKQSNNWCNVAERSATKAMKETWDMWNSSKMTSIQIGEKLKRSRPAITRHLKHGLLAGKCNYTPNEIENRQNRPRRPIIQLDENGEFIREWMSITDAASYLKIHHSGIGKCCRKERKKAGGFKWMYAEDYGNMGKDEK